MEGSNPTYRDLHLILDMTLISMSD